MRHRFDSFCAFHGCNCPNYTVEQTGRANDTANFAMSGYTTGMLWTHLCRRDLVLSLLQAQTRVNHYI